MSLITLPAYLFGSRTAILELASTRWTLLIGGLFVLSAGLAREYDGADLLHEPWHLLIPFGSSLVACGVLFLIAFLIPLRNAELPNRLIWSRFWSFLGLFWMTAPLAWIYAIPFERFLDESTAITANFVSLGIVSLWRVALMTRVVAMLTGCSAGAALGRVLTFGCTVVVLLSLASVAPVFMLAMAGTRFPPAEETRLQITNLACLAGVPGFIVALVIQQLTVLPAADTWPWLREVAPASASGRGRTGLFALAIVSVLLWLLPMSLTQVEQQQARTVDSLWNQGDHAEALAYLSARQPSDFPPHWQPPPRWIRHFKWVQVETLLNDLNDALSTRTAPWLRQRHVAQLDDLLGTVFTKYGTNFTKPEFMEQLVSLLEKQPDGPDLVRRHCEGIQVALAELRRDRDRERERNSDQAAAEHPLERLQKLINRE